MQEFKSFSERILNLKKEQFESLALELFQFQAKTNKLYKEFLRIRKVEIDQVKTLDQIPFMPIRFFKDHKVVCGDQNELSRFYSSSGTTGMITSRHYIWSEEWYLKHAQQIFESIYGSLNDFHVLALLPAYLERPGSSLVAMAQHFIQVSDSEYSGFYLYNHDELLQKVNKLRHGSRKILLLGVTFALLDLAESNRPFELNDKLIVMETGGMKGRRKEMIREEVHDTLKNYFGVASVHSEYGMTEMMSQAYSKGHGKYTLPVSVSVMLRDINDPWSWASRSQGGINVIDLGNFHSCSFLETQDLGRFDAEGNLEVLGRIDNSEIRGCNLLVQ